MSLLAPGATVGPFTIEEAIGQGGMGTVYRATRGPDGEVVALKIVLDELAADATYVRRFEREAELAASLDHPHLVRVVEAGESGGRRYIASRFVDGVSLQELLAPDVGLSAADTVRVVGHIAAGLDELHRRGIVHRDVKPANVLLDESGAYLADFGLARGAAHTVLTRTGKLVGTVDYLAPEVIRGAAAGPASDVYALGCVAYACLAGEPPFGDRDVVATCVAHLEEEPPSLVGLGGVGEELAWAVTQGLAKEPGDRPSTATAYARLLASAATA